MKNLKKIASVFLALVMTLALCVPAFAAKPVAVTGPFTITIDNDKTGHTYEAYQIFKGDLSKEVIEKEDGSKTEKLVLSNIEWGDNVSEAGKAALIESVGLEAGATAADVADKLAAGHDTDQAKSFAKIAGTAANLKGTPVTSTGPVDGKYTISNLEAGYYLVMDQADTLDGENDAYTRYILQVVENQEIKPKSDVPKIDKKIVESDGTTKVDGTTRNVGDTVNFEVTSTVPDTTGYETYKYVVSDTMSDGLTFVENSIEVTIGGTKVEPPVYTVDTTVEGKTFVITFPNLVNYTGKEVVITYRATVNDGALETDVETNTVGLQYSNNPNKDDELGKTPDKTVYVYDFDIEINKYEGNGKETDGEIATAEKLDGAKFVLRQKDTNNYYAWNAGTKKVEWKEITTNEATWKETEWTDAGATVKTTAENGKVSFEGLAAGKYELVEIEAPTGYNLLSASVPVEITITLNADGTLETSSATVGGNGVQYQQPQNVANASGSLLPSTGGIGTTIFYVVGGILVAGAAILLITRKRMNDEQ